MGITGEDNMDCFWASFNKSRAEMFLFYASLAQSDNYSARKSVLFVQWGAGEGILCDALPV